MQNKQPLHTFTTKLGTAKQIERSRIWIEGRRLIDAGFTVGQFFAKEWNPDTLTLTLLAEDDIITAPPCKVSGKGEKPIIDITGECVREVFGAKCTHVVVEYFPGRIEIRCQR